MARHASGQDDGKYTATEGDNEIAITTLQDEKPPVYTTEKPPEQHQQFSMKEDCIYQEAASCQPSKTHFRRSFNTSSEHSDEPLPSYSCSVHAEAVMMMKLEVENATKRAENRRWDKVYLVLHGTSLNIYQLKKDWSWAKIDGLRLPHGTCSLDGHTGSSEDTPPGIKAGKLVKSYGLLYADVGIASDYAKRRYVIRVRADADQFLLSCIELDTFVRWLDKLFAAIDISAPLDDREFPQDQFIPRIQRLRWLRGDFVVRPTENLNPNSQPANRYSPNTTGTAGALARAAGVERRGPIINTNGELVEPRSSRDSRNSTVVNFDTNGKWRPKQVWTRRHDLLYAKLCYATLKFRSPRKSNYVIMKGEMWYVDWPVGRISRVQPPEYREVEVGGPFYETHIGNSRL